MSSEYRRVLHEWARSHMSESLRYQPIVDVLVETNEGGWLSEATFDEPGLFVQVVYLDERGVQMTRHLDIGLQNGGLAMSTLLHELFALAAREES